MGVNYSTQFSSDPSNVFDGKPGTIRSTSTRSNDGGFISSDSYRSNTPVIRDTATGDIRYVHTADDLNDSDLVSFQGIPMTVRQYLDAGLDPSKLHSAFPGSREQPSAPQKPDVMANDPSVGSQDDFGEDVQLDTKSEILDQANGNATGEEVLMAENIVMAVQLQTGLDVEAQTELAQDVALGEIKEGDEFFRALQQKTGISYQAVKSSVDQVSDTMRRAAMKEMSPQDFNELDVLATQNPEIRKLVVNHAINRMHGRHKGVTWAHVAQLARQFAKR